MRFPLPIAVLVTIFLFVASPFVVAQSGHLLKLPEGAVLTDHLQKTAIETLTGLDPEIQYSFDGLWLKVRSKLPIDGATIASELTNALGITVTLLPPGHIIPPDHSRSP
jgi:hypothetical protein